MSAVRVCLRPLARKAGLTCNGRSGPLGRREVGNEGQTAKKSAFRSIPSLQLASLGRLGYTLATVLVASFIVSACAGPSQSEPGKATFASAGTIWSVRDWSADFTATRARDTAGFSLAGHPLDVAFTPDGGAWGVGEFGMQATRAQGSTLTKHNIPLKTYVQDGQLVGWTQPFQSLANGQAASSSDLGESVLSAAGAVWVAQGGGQEKSLTDNASILTRISTSTGESCAIPIPGDNVNLIGLAHDTKRNRIYFATSEGEGSRLGWVKASGLKTRCQNGLDYGGNPTLSAEENAALRANAQTVVDSLKCTPSQDLSIATNCVHMVPTPMPTGAAHLTYDATGDALWMTNWGDRKLRRFNPNTGNIATYAAPPASEGVALPLPWQIASNATHVFMNEYNGNRLLAYNKVAKTWAVVPTPTDALGVESSQVQTHSITLAGDRLWFTVSDEDGNAKTAVGWVDVKRWAAGAPIGVLYTGFESLPGDAHSFRGLDVNAAGTVALADSLARSTVLLEVRN